MLTCGWRVRRAAAVRQGILVCIVVVLAATALLLDGCAPAGQAVAPTTAPAAATKAPAAAASPAAPAATKPAATAGAGSASGAPNAGALADSGKTIYASICAKCHGDKGQGVTGPAVLGPDPQFGRFANAKEIHDYVRTAMPLDNPGSLTTEQALQVTAFLLVETNFAQRDAPLTDASLSSIRLQR